MHHKKKKTKASRGGSKWNKPWKSGRTPTESPYGEKFSDHKRRIDVDLEGFVDETHTNKIDKSKNSETC